MRAARCAYKQTRRSHKPPHRSACAASALASARGASCSPTSWASPPRCRTSASSRPAARTSRAPPRAPSSAHVSTLASRPRRPWARASTLCRACARRAPFASCGPCCTTYYRTTCRKTRTSAAAATPLSTPRASRPVRPSPPHHALSVPRLVQRRRREARAGPRAHVVSDFESREELIQSLLTSSHIPVYFDGSLLRRFHSAWACDGAISNFIPQPPTAEYTARICCFPTMNMNYVRPSRLTRVRYVSCCTACPATPNMRTASLRLTAVQHVGTIHRRARETSSGLGRAARDSQHDITPARRVQNANIHNL